jgi:hypothetical protein
MAASIENAYAFAVFLKVNWNLECAVDKVKPEADEAEKWWMRACSVLYSSEVKIGSRR